MPSKLCIFPFMFIIFFLFMFFTFLGRQGYCPRSYVASGAMRNLDLCSSLHLKVCALHWFYVFFWKIDFNCKWKSFKALDLERISWFLMKWRSLWMGFIVDFCLSTFNPFLRELCSTNDRLKLTLQKKSNYRWSKKEMKMHKTIERTPKGP